MAHQEAASGYNFAGTPLGMSFAVSNLATSDFQLYAYVADHNNFILYKCDMVDTTGELENCAPTPTTGAPTWQP